MEVGELRLARPAVCPLVEVHDDLGAAQLRQRHRTTRRGLQRERRRRGPESDGVRVRRRRGPRGDHNYGRDNRRARANDLDRMDEPAACVIHGLPPETEAYPQNGGAGS